MCLFNFDGVYLMYLVVVLWNYYIYMGVWEGKLNKEIKMKVKKILGISDFIVDEL